MATARRSQEDEHPLIHPPGSQTKPANGRKRLCPSHALTVRRERALFWPRAPPSTRFQTSARIARFSSFGEEKAVCAAAQTSSEGHRGALLSNYRGHLEVRTDGSLRGGGSRGRSSARSSAETRRNPPAGPAAPRCLFTTIPARNPPDSEVRDGPGRCGVAQERHTWRGRTSAFPPPASWLVGDVITVAPPTTRAHTPKKCTSGVRREERTGRFHTGWRTRTTPERHGDARPGKSFPNSSRK